ncbi:MAG: metallophosphoesterase [Bacteroidales bacterium]|nr:metallophosphoesterase [Bacteroidales bacterium]
MDRRHFVKVTAASVAGLSLGGLKMEAGTKKDKTSGEGESYSVVLIGDTHYDRKPDELYHEGYSDPNPEREANHRKEFVRNDEMWKSRIRSLLRRASKLVGDDTRMAFQLGDIIQGDTGSAESHKIMLDDAFCYIKGAIGRVPLVTCAGNHDLRASDDKIATQAYTEYMTERMSEELGKKIEKTCFSFNIGPDAFIVVDFTHPDDEEIDRLFAETEGARHTFVLIHAPVFPSQSPTGYNWIIHGRDGKPEARRHFRQLLAKREAIVICGHTHTTELEDWYGDGGRITQMIVSSVWKSEEAGKYKVVSDKVEDYGSEALKTGKKAAKDMIGEYLPGMKRYSYGLGCGSYKLHVSADSVTVDYYAGNSMERTAEFRLR